MADKLFRLSDIHMVRGRNGFYQIDKDLGEGSFGISYLASVMGLDTSEDREEMPLRHGDKVVVKIPKVDLSRSLDETIGRLGAIQVQTIREFSALKRLKRIKNVAHVYDIATELIDLPDGDTLLGSYSVHEFIEGEDFPVYLRRKFCGQSGVFCGIQSATEWFDLARKMAEIIEHVHAERLVHGDIWGDNFRMRGEQPVLIDFGQAMIVDLTFERVGGEQSHPYMAPERRRPDRTWHQPADMYSFGCLLYYMATGLQPPSPTDDFDTLKYSVIDALKTQNSTLYHENFGIADVICRCLRVNPADRADATTTLRDISLFNRESDIYKVSTPDDIMVILENIKKNTSDITQSNPIFCMLIGKNLIELEKNIREIGSRLYNVSGYKEDFVNALLSCITSLGEGDEIKCLCTPNWWSPDNFGVNGRIVSALKMAIASGANFKIAFLTTQDHIRTHSTRKSLISFCELHKELTEVGIRFGSNDIEEKSNYIGVVLAPEAKYEEILYGGYTFILIEGQNIKGKTLIAPSFRERGGIMSTIRLWDQPTTRESKLSKLRELLSVSKPICAFMTDLY